MTKSVITLDEENHTYEETVREVARLIEEGYTSGYDPRWSIEKDCRVNLS